ncbi:MAG TPA: succinate dehydrogenase assembly factor 2 [Dongiaceae bacterium]
MPGKLVIGANRGLRMLGRTDGLACGDGPGRPSYRAMGWRKRAMTDSLDVDRKRLRFRSWHRGTREMDLLLGRFADGSLDGYDAAGLRAYAALLEQPDPDIYDWVSGRGECPEGELRPIVAALTEFHSRISS